MIKDVSFYSVCEHHLVPFFGKVHIAYIPQEGRIAGLSKFGRVIETLAKRPQLQERLTTQIAESINQSLKPLGVIVYVEAEHMSMTMRGIKKPGSKILTSACRGIFEEDSQLRSETTGMINFE